MVLTSKCLTITKVEFLQDLKKKHTEISDSWLNHWSFWWMSSKPRCCGSIRSNWWKADHPQPRGWKVSSRSSKRRGALINCLGHAGHNVHHSFSWCDMILWCQSHNTWCLHKWRMDFRWSPCGNSMKQMRRTWVLPFVFSIGRLVAGLPISDGIACETSMNSQVHWGDYVRRRTRAISRLCSQPQRKIVEFQRKFLSSGNFSVFFENFMAMKKSGKDTAVVLVKFLWRLSPQTVIYMVNSRYLRIRLLKFAQKKSTRFQR